MNNTRPAGGAPASERPRRRTAARKAAVPAAGVARPLVLPGELSIYTVAELHPQWLAWLAVGDEVDGSADFADVDGSAVAEVDAAGLQMLLSLAGSLAQRQRPLRLLAPSPTLSRACQALGMVSLLGTDTVMPA